MLLQVWFNSNKFLQSYTYTAIPKYCVKYYGAAARQNPAAQSAIARCRSTQNPNKHKTNSSRATLAVCPPFRSHRTVFKLRNQCSAQWRRTDFCFLPSADFLSLMRQGVFGSAFVQLRWALLTEQTVDLSARQSAFVRVATHTENTRQFTHQERITTRHGMATYIQWRRIPDRSESTSESKCKGCHPRSQSPRKLPVLLSTRPRSLGIQIF